MRFLIVMTASVLAVVSSVDGAPSELPVIPKVKRYVPAGAEIWHIGKTLRVAAEDPAAVTVGERLSRDWKRCARGFVAGTVDVTLRLAADATLGDEGYRLTLTPNGAMIAAPTRTGLVWGTQTLLQLARSDQAIAVGTIEDWPDYPVRGVTFDVARKFFSMSYLRDLVRELSYCKMNTFHVHLNDDVVFSDKVYWAFRLESDVPGLTSRDGSYTKAEFRAFVREAAEQGVNVVPEIDAPGHSLAFRMVRPDLALTNGWDQLDVRKPGTIAFIKSVWNEYLDGSDPVFAGPDVHVGTDEYCRGSIEGYRAFADAIFRHVRGKGKRIGAWGAFGTCTGRTEVVAAPDIVLDLWHHKSYPPEQALKDGYSVTSVPGSFLYIVPGAPYYNDYVNEKKVIETWSPSVGDGGHPIPRMPGRLRGGKFAVWNDHVGNGITTDDVFDRLYPALRVVAEKTWSAEACDWASYAARRDRVGEAPGLDLLDAHNPETLGWTRGGWEVSFELRASGMAERLFDDGTSTVRIFSCGRLGFSRDGYDVEFDFVPEVGKWHEVRLAGTPKGTTLWVDGRLVNDYKPEWRHYPWEKRWSYRVWRTLHFPLSKAIGRTSQVRKFRIIKK